MIPAQWTVEATDVTGRPVFAGNDARAAPQPAVPASFSPALEARGEVAAPAPETGRLWPARKEHEVFWRFSTPAYAATID